MSTQTILGLDLFGWRVVHMAAVVVFLGNVTVTALWKALADRTRHPATIAFAQRLVTLTDWVFTAGGVALILVSGLALAWLSGRLAITPDGLVFGPGWLRWGLGLFVLSGLAWALVLIPVQIIQARMARRFAPEAPVPARYWRLARLWLWVGIAALVPPYLTLGLMVLKP